MGSDVENKPKIKRRNIYLCLAVLTIIFIFEWLARFYTKGVTSGMEIHYYPLPRGIEKPDTLGAPNSFYIDHGTYVWLDIPQIFTVYLIWYKIFNVGLFLTKIFCIF